MFALPSRAFTRNGSWFLSQGIPFSGIPTAFPVEALGKRYYANCVWDAFGVAAALHADAIIPTADGFSGEPLTLEVKSGPPIGQLSVAHFAVPAAHWWDDIVFT